ncbi:MAG TPA: response regulator [Bacteroidia bacterium]|nr:response regulator [Bacteroidia bacterium]
MSKIKIGIVEDDMIIADALSEMLTSLGYEVPESATRYSEAIDMIERDKPDLLLIDINLIGQMNGIDIGHTINKKFALPFIFLTANVDADTVERAKEVKPLAFLAKPITKEQLFSAIEIAFSNFNSSLQKPSVLYPVPSIRDSLFIKDGYAFRKIYFIEILYLQSDANYVTIHLSSQKKIMVRMKLDNFLEYLDKKIFIRIHRSFAVNSKMIEGVFPNQITVSGINLPVGSTYREALLKTLGINGN